MLIVPDPASLIAVHGKIEVCRGLCVLGGAFHDKILELWQITNCLYAHTVNCGYPGKPSNGDTMVTVTTFGSIVNHTCNEGYELIGANERECLANGSWSAPLPSCQSKQPRYSYSCI